MGLSNNFHNFVSKEMEGVEDQSATATNGKAEDLQGENVKKTEVHDPKYDGKKERKKGGKEGEGGKVRMREEIDTIH